MPVLIRLSLAIEVLLVWAEQLIPGAAHYLPIAGSHYMQLSSTVILSIAILELWDLITRQ